MSDWRRVNQRIAAAKATRDPVAALRRLFDEENDGHVAMALGRQFRVDGDLTQAVLWFERAEALYPLERFKAEARQAKVALTRASGNPTGVSNAPVSDTLHIISCSRQKAWDDPRIVAAYLPAEEAYRGAEITAWRQELESRNARWLILSAKYGFIEPDHPIGPYNVTFKDSTSGPISDATLRAQVEHQVRWTDRLPLRAFRRVVVHRVQHLCCESEEGLCRDRRRDSNAGRRRRRLWRDVGIDDGHCRHRAGSRNRRRPWSAARRRVRTARLRRA